MADEITIKESLTYAGKESSEGALPFSITEKTYSVDQTGKDYTKGTQSIGTSSAEAIAVSADIGTQGLWIIHNRNANTGVLKLGISGNTAAEMLVKVEPGDPPARFRANAAVYAIASGAVVNIEFTCFEK